MNLARTYLDYNATAPPRPQAKAALLAALDVFGNPSSVHAEGRKARALVEDAREQVAGLLGAAPAEVIFTSGGSEANAGVVAAGWDTIFLAGVEHESVRGPAAASGARLIELPVGDNGRVEPEKIAGHAGIGRAGPVLVTLQLANNETGVVQRVAEAAAVARAQGFATHTDAVQAAGRMDVDFATLGVDYLTVSGHKLGSPKGVGAVVVREPARLPAFARGGGQERGRRAGTENVPAIAAFGAAAAAARSDRSSWARIRRLRDRLEQEAGKIAPQAIVVAGSAERLCNTTCLALPGHRAEMLLIKLDLAGVAVSAGAACSSGKVGRSHVLDAMGLAPEIAGAAIRISLGWASSDADVDAFISVWRGIAGAMPRRQAA